MRLNTRIEIVERIETRDNDGYKKYDYNKIYKCWAKINSLYGKELYLASMVNKENNLNVKIRYCKLLERLFLDENRLLNVRWKNKIFNIFTPDFLSFDKKFIILKLELKE